MLLTRFKKNLVRLLIENIDINDNIENLNNCINIHTNLVNFFTSYFYFFFIFIETIKIQLKLVNPSKSSSSKSKSKNSPLSQSPTNQGLNTSASNLSLQQDF
jgi:hypothetical protein